MDWLELLQDVIVIAVACWIVPLLWRDLTKQWKELRALVAAEVVCRAVDFVFARCCGDIAE